MNENQLPDYSAQRSRKARAQRRKRKQARALLALFAILAIAALCGVRLFKQNAAPEVQPAEETAAEPVSYNDVVIPENAKWDKLLQLVNENCLYNSSYAPNTVTVEGEEDYYLAAEAAEAYLQMRDAAEAAGISLHLSAAYINSADQQNMFDASKQKALDNGSTEEEAILLAADDAGSPGANEHITALAIDLASDDESDASEASFAKTAAYQWLIAHCEEYGYILRYPDGKSDITGREFKPNHFRYIGQEYCEAFHGLCLEEIQALIAEQETAKE